MKVYFVSGLAADRRVFKHIKLPHGYEIIHIDWIAPAKNESLEEYSSRLSEKIVPGEPFALLGLSMGGMIVSEISRQYAANKKTKPVITILLSSVPVSRHLPKHFKLARSLQLYKFIPVKFLKSASFLNRFFSSDNKEDKAILHQVVKDSDPGFIRWAMQAVLEWKNEVLPQPLVHIHGTKDRILPARYTKPTHLIYKASHLMVMGRANEINLLLSEALLSVSRT